MRVRQRPALLRMIASRPCRASPKTPSLCAGDALRRHHPPRATRSAGAKTPTALPGSSLR